MDQFIRGRLRDPRFQLHGPAFVPGASVSGWSEARSLDSDSTRAMPKLIYSKDNAQSQGSCWTGYHRDYSKSKYSDGSCVKDGAGGKEKKKKKRRKKASGSGSESVTSSESDGEGGRRKKARKTMSKKD